MNPYFSFLVVIDIPKAAILMIYLRNLLDLGRLLLLKLGKLIL